jgi:hypothetical protein
MKLNDYELHKLYDDFLDEVFPECSIAGGSYCTSRALKELDPIAYRCGFADWLDAEVSDGRLFEKGGEYYDEEPTEDDEETED